MTIETFDREIFNVFNENNQRSSFAWFSKTYCSDKDKIIEVKLD